MWIQELARELYRVQQEVDRLEDQLATALPSEGAILRDNLRKAKAERQRLRNILAGAKKTPPGPHLPATNKPRY